jgi:hypothetical protein
MTIVGKLQRREYIGGRDMNIYDFEVEIIEGDRLKNIFKRQAELREKYHHIEKKNGFHSPEKIPVNIHDAKDQFAIKDLFWRFTEELGEALDAYNGGHLDHCHEEIADALHFLVEACLLVGITPRDVAGYNFRDIDGLEYLYGANPVRTDLIGESMMIAASFAEMMASLGMSANCLKNKPWKNTHMMTDEDVFRSRVIITFNKFITFAKYCGLNNPQELYDLYFRKSQVNKFRQRSNY